MSETYNPPPLQWDEERDEPFLELEIKGQAYRMTMWRETDGDDMVSPCPVPSIVVHLGISFWSILTSRSEIGITLK